MANTLRRVMLAEVPTMCIDIVEYEENTSVLTDEFLAHRLGAATHSTRNTCITHSPCTGLIPLRSTRKMSHWQYNHACADCDNYCDKCSALFSLDCSFESLAAKRNISPNDVVHLTVTSADLHCHSEYVSPCHYSGERDRMENREGAGIAIVTLGPGQQLKFQAIARKGIAKVCVSSCAVRCCSLSLVGRSTRSGRPSRPCP